MKKIILTLIIGMFMISLISAGALDLKPTDSKNQIDFKSKDYTIKADGLYDDKDIKQKTKEQAEIWIDKKVGDTYHIDSLVAEDTTVKIELFYDIQPDTIYYLSHTGKYEEYVTWTWEDKTNCGLDKDNFEIPSCGGYATIEVILEYGLGSNTFTSAISGTTWNNNGVDITLDSTNYTQSGTDFIINDINYAWNEINVSYSYDATVISNQGAYDSGTDTITGIGGLATWIAVIVVVLAAAIVLGIVINSFGNRNGV